MRRPQFVSTLQLDLIDGCKRLLDWRFETAARRREFRPRHRSCPVEFSEIHSSFSWQHYWYPCGSTSTFRRARWLECWTNLDQRLSVARVHSVCAEGSAWKQWSRSTTFPPYYAWRAVHECDPSSEESGYTSAWRDTPRWKLRSGIKSRCWESSFKRLSKRVTSCTFKQLSWSTWRCHNVTINLNIEYCEQRRWHINSAARKSNTRGWKRYGFWLRVCDSLKSFVERPFLACAESRAGSLDIELYLWLSDASFGISLESARPYLFLWSSNGSVSSDIDDRWQVLVNCRAPWTNSCQSDSRLVKHARTKAYLAQKGVPLNAVSIELASQKKAWKFVMDFSQDFCRKARHIGHLPSQSCVKNSLCLRSTPHPGCQDQKKVWG